MWLNLFTCTQPSHHQQKPCKLNLWRTYFNRYLLLQIINNLCRKMPRAFPYSPSLVILSVCSSSITGPIRAYYLLTIFCIVLLWLLSLNVQAVLLLTWLSPFMPFSPLLDRRCRLTFLCLTCTFQSWKTHPFHRLSSF